MLMSEKCRNNNNSDNPLTSRRTDGGKNGRQRMFLDILSTRAKHKLMRKFSKNIKVTKLLSCFLLSPTSRYTYE